MIDVGMVLELSIHLISIIFFVNKWQSQKMVLALRFTPSKAIRYCGKPLIQKRKDMLTDTMLRNLKPRDKQYKLADRDGLYVAVSVT